MRRGAVSWALAVTAATSISLALAIAFAMVTIGACLPDLPEVVRPPHAATVCGDGIIDLDAGEECDPGEAGAIGCGACRVQCEGGALDRASGHCYFAAARTQSLLLAVGACGEAGAHVSTFASEAELTFAAAVGQPSADFWVGLVHNDLLRDAGYAPPPQSIEPGWSPDCAGCFAQVPPDASAIPGDPTSMGNCIVARQGAALQWVQSGCAGTAPRDTICEREPVGARSSFCIGGVCFDVPRTSGAKRYLLVPTPVRAEDAPAMCESAAGALVVFDSREEREQIAREVADQRVVGTIDSFWIGLRADDAGAWTWEGDASSPLPWGEREPAHPSARAYVQIRQGALDSELAHAALADEVHVSLCQIVVP